MAGYGVGADGGWDLIFTLDIYHLGSQLQKQRVQNREDGGVWWGEGRGLG